MHSDSEDPPDSCAPEDDTHDTHDTSDTGLTTAEAKTRLLAALAPTPALATRTAWTATRLTLLVATLTAAILQLATGVHTLTRTHGRQHRGAAQTAESVLLLGTCVAGILVERRDAWLAQLEVCGREHAAREMLERWDGRYAAEGVQTRRDGVWRPVPVLLLAAGDVVRASDGVPADVCVRPAQGCPTLAVVTRTPLEQVVGCLRARPKARSLVGGQTARVLRWCAFGVLPALLLAALLGSVLALTLVRRRGQSSGASAGMEVVGGALASVLLPAAGACALWPAYWRLACTLCSARALALFDALRRSTTEYEDTADIDEFDVEALPPTKDVHVGARSVLRRLLALWRSAGCRYLARSARLAETLGCVTVICCVDREGTLAEHVPVAEQAVVPADEAYDVVDLDESARAARDPVWRARMPALRAVALACALRPPADPWTDARRLPRALGLAADDLAAYAVCSRAKASLQGVAGSVALTCVRQNSGAPQVFADGAVAPVLVACLDYFDGSVICPLDDERMAALHALHQNALLQDLRCVAFAYRPGDDLDAARSGVHLSPLSPDDLLPQVPADSPLPRYLTRASRERRALAAAAAAGAMRPLILLGLVTFAHEPKVDVCDVIEDLSVAGIRFVYFSPTPGRQSKAFAERLGLETDWNTCILLSSPPPAAAAAAEASTAAGYVEDHDIKARLPRGIDSIRPHLEQVDDIPLQISLFAEAAPPATREMVRIFQENGDIVCCIAGALGDANALTFAAADLAVAVEPRPHLLHAPFDEPPAGASASATVDNVAAALTCMSCPLFLHHDTSLYTLLQVVSEARRLLAALQLAATLLCATAVAASLVNLIACLCLLPPALEGAWLLWTIWVAAPTLAAALLFAPPDDAIMSTMPLKNHAHVADLARFALYAAVRAAPPVALTAAVYATAARAMLPGLWHTNWLTLTHTQQASLWAAQSLAAAAFIFHVACVSATMMHRTRMTAEYLPFRNRVWVAAFVAVVAVSFAAAGLVLGLAGAEVGRIPWYSYVLALPAPVVLLPLQDLCKMHDRKRWTRLQKLAKLEFNTKLGLHSPL